MRGLSLREICLAPFFLPVGHRAFKKACAGEVPEWLNGAVSKTVERLRVPGVRIPPSPPFILANFDIVQRSSRFERGFSIG